MALCASCRDFDIQKFNAKSNNTQSFELTLVAIAASEGCPFCKFIYTNKPSHGIAREMNDLWIHYKMLTPADIGYDMLGSGPGLRFTQLKVWIGSKKALVMGRAHKDFRVVSEPGSAAELCGDVPRAYIGNTSDSEYHFNVLRQWLMDCQSKSHSVCNMTIPGDVLINDNYEVPLPSRLISVGHPGDEMVYLREAKGEKGTYVTLSYVWGGPGRIPKTTSSNIEERCNGILVSSLPKTFQDVITITRKLNVPYVWIDALCIIQNDQEDWNREVGQMARIYQFSLLTIAATGAEDASRGCFLDREPTSIEIGPVINLPYRTKEGLVAGNFMVFEQHTTFGEEYDRFIEKSPLLKRGWVFQERVLSRRMVHYTRGRMFFECRTHRFMNECQESVSKEGTQPGFWGPELKGKLFPKKDLSPFDSTLLGRWYMAVKIYTQLRLTKTSDKLAALAGVAREFQMLLSKEREKAGKTGRDGSALHTPLYISGLWSHDLLYGLSWYPSKPPKILIAGNNAPSWSWASWHTPIEWPGVTTFKPECKIIVPEMLEQYRRAGSSQMAAKSRVKASELSSFKADLPRGITLDTTMTFLSELQITGKIREVWRRPQTPNCLTNDERKDVSDACEMNVDERYWLQYCHPVYIEENSTKPAGYGCFEDHWLAKSVESITLGGVGTELNAGLDEAEAVALLLSLKENDVVVNKAMPSNHVDNDLERAIAASLGKAPQKEISPKPVDLDEEFNDQLAIALMMSAEESSKSKNLSVATEAEELGEDGELAEMLRQEENLIKGTSGHGIPLALTETKGETVINSQQAGEAIQDGEISETNDIEESETSTANPETSELTEEPLIDATTLHTNETRNVGSLSPTTTTLPSGIGRKGKQQEVTEEAIDYAPTNEEDFGTVEHSINNQPPPPPPKDTKGKSKSTTNSPLMVTLQPPTIPSRTTSTQPSSTPASLSGPSASNPQRSANNQLHIPSKLHFLPLYSTKATGSLSYLGLSATVYTVLFLRAAGEREGRRVFERVGVGKIIEKGLFGSAKMETVVLV